MSLRADNLELLGLVESISRCQFLLLNLVFRPSADPGAFPLREFPQGNSDAADKTVCVIRTKLS